MKHKKSTFLNQRGFSIVELLFIVAIMGILLALTTINLLTVQRKTTLNSTLEVFMSEIKEQQLKAMIGDTQGSATAESYGVYLTSTSYTLFRGTAYNPVSTFNTRTTLTPTVELTTTFPSSTIVFSRGSGAIANFNPSFNTVTFRDIDSNVSKTVTINRYGVVSGIN